MPVLRFNLICVRSGGKEADDMRDEPPSWWRFVVNLGRRKWRRYRAGGEMERVVGVQI